ncbi:LysR family transcriptional regulator [Pseudenhygromyxa sp. WMMC2535]|uniref:LysR family transcriptional regulator n=1 Tax=Pseudenhygromyxa sp. WMMC2535 TaxID=2712867 RepID=UPI001595D085|nr:LysR family transcriptional regulator [Pseudenhygromyxa sp. WMMC2535]NVB39130.1 LysR family transcriptional regulator [Pseudenhygromyxa sp. WMMC2535]
MNHPLVMQTEDLQAFLATVEGGSLSAAARTLGVPKSTISRRLTRLEDELGVQLIARGSRSLQLSDLGEELHRRAAPVLADLDEIARTLRDQGSEPVGELRVAVPEDLSMAFMGALAGRLLRLHPKLQLRVSSSNRLVDLIAEGVDVALRVHMNPLASVASLKVRRLGKVELAAYAAPSYLESAPSLRRPADLGAHPCLTMASLGTRWTLTRARPEEREQIEVHAAMLTNDHFALRDAACEGAGVCVAPSFLCTQAVAEGRLVRVLPRWSLQNASLSMLWPNARVRSPRVQAFIDVAVEFFAEVPGLSQR